MLGSPVLGKICDQKANAWPCNAFLQVSRGFGYELVSDSGTTWGTVSGSLTISGKGGVDAVRYCRFFCRHYERINGTWAISAGRSISFL